MNQHTLKAFNRKEEPILKEGRNCWRIRQAGRAAFLVDAAQYFEHLTEAVSRARQTVYIAGWDIDSRVQLLRRAGGKSKPSSLGRFLNQKISSTPGLQAHVLSWDFAMLYAMERELMPLFKLGWKTHKRLHFQLDSEHPLGASHHQKFVVIDNALSFCGGIDLTKSRWDTPEHLPDDRRRRTPDGKPYEPYHDVQLAVDGDAAATLGHLFRERWFWATGKRLEAQKANHAQDPWPENMRPDLTDVKIAVARTLPAFKGREEIREVEALYVDAVVTARDYIYVENQYLTSGAIARAFSESLKKRQGPEIVIVLPRKSRGWLEQSTMDAIRAQILNHLFEADKHQRLRAYYPVVGGGDRSVFVHAKVMIVDDRLVSVGSSNLSNRSMGLDSECDLAVEADGEPRVAKAIAHFRNRLLAEHLGSRVEEVGKALKEKRSLIETVESLGGPHRRLKELDKDQKVTLDGTSLVSDMTLLDPEKPGSLDSMMDQFVHEEDPSERFWLAKIVIVLFALVALAAAWRWTPLSEWISVDRLSAWASALRGNPLAPLGVVAAYVVGGLLMVPVTLLVGVTAVVFNPFPGSLYAIFGCLSSACLTFGIGARLGKNTLRRVAGTKLNLLSKRLAKRGILTVVVVRNLPLAPFTIVNMVAGASQIKFKDFILGTALGMAPGITAVTLFADRLTQAIKHPHWINLAIVAAVALAVVLSVWWTKRRLLRGG
jgi:phospholipase D1/2